MQEFLVHMDPVWDERMTRWCIELREALRGRRALSRFPVVEPARQEVGPLELSSNPVGEGPRDEGGTTREAREAVKPSERRGIRSCSYGAQGLAWRD